METPPQHVPFAAVAASYGVSLSHAQLTRFEQYLELLWQWSERMNLVGDATPAVVERRHFLESIAFGAALREREIMRPASRVLDVGAGAGFPGLVLKIVWPGLDLTLLEATAKKTAFLAAVVDDLELKEVAIVTARAEEAGHDATLREGFDLVAARAVAPLPALLELTLPFARVGGHVATTKGSRLDAELGAAGNAMRVLGAGRHGLLPLDVPGPTQRILVVAKAKPTPPEYPRAAGLIKKRPL